MEDSSNDRPQIYYNLSVNFRVEWQAHSLSNAGNNGSNRLLGRRQLLADGTETDACSGNIAKHANAELVAEKFEATGIPLCPPCQERDGRRAAALIGKVEPEALTIEKIINNCGLCDAHGVLITSKKANSDSGEQARQRVFKETLLDFSFSLALPGHFSQTDQLVTRSGASKEEGQMLMKMPSRSGQYAGCIRYLCAGVGVDTEKWKLIVEDENQRILRHKAILSALVDYILSPDGALTGTMLPHLTNLIGAIVIRTTAGRAPIYSALDPTFIDKLKGLASEEIRVFPFGDVVEFNTLMRDMIKNSVPALPARYSKNAKTRI